MGGKSLPSPTMQGKERVRNTIVPKQVRGVEGVNVSLSPCIDGVGLSGLTLI